MAVYFFSEDISYSLPSKGETILWIDKVLREYGQKAESINYIFCSDDHLLKVNQQYLNHDTYTDIITFDSSESAGLLEADIYISIDRVRENATSLNIEFDLELHRVIIHGLLHLLGYSDKSEDEKKEMREKEEACLSLR